MNNYSSIIYKIYVKNFSYLVEKIGLKFFKDIQDFDIRESRKNRIKNPLNSLYNIFMHSLTLIFLF